MRILRGKSNLEISSNGFALFVVGLIVATFIGGAVRTLLGSDRVHQRIVAELRNRFPKHEITIGASEVLLSRGIWPALGLRISDVSFVQQTCGRLSFKVEVPTAVLPIDLWSLRGRPRLGDVEMKSGHVHLGYTPCRETPSARGDAESQTTPVTAAAPPVTPAWRPPRFEWKEWGKALDSVELADFSVTFENQPDWKVQVHHAVLDFTEEFDGRASIEVQRSLPFGSLSHAVEVEAQSDNSVLKWQMSSEFKEGRLAWSGNWDTGSQSADTRVEISQLPVRDMLAELHQIGVMARSVEMKSSWINCSLGWEGNLTRPHETPVHVRVCKEEGALGGIRIENAEVYALQADPLKVPIEIVVTNLQLQPIVEAFNRQVLPAVINKLGVWSGKIWYQNPQSWRLDGHLSGSEVVFSNQSVRGKQAFRGVHTTAEKAQRLINAQIDQVEIMAGEFEGSVGFSLNDDWRSGTFHVNVDRLILSPGIQALLVGGGWSALKLNGTGTLQDGELSDWKGTFEIPEIAGEGWTARQLRVGSKYAPGVFTLDGQLSRLELGLGWKYFPTLRDRVAPGSSVIAVRDVKSKVEVRGGGGEILSMTATDDASQRPWRGRGSWQRDRDLVAVLTGFALGRQRTFTFRAEKGLLSVDEQASAASVR